MWNKNKALIEWLRERHREMRCEDLNRNLQPGMLTYLDDDIYSQIVSLKDTPKKEVNENDIAEAIRTISYGMGIPVGEIVLSLKRLQRNNISDGVRLISLATGIPASEVEMHFLIPEMEKGAKGMNSMAQSFADATQMLEAVCSEYKKAEEILHNFGKDLGRGVECFVTKDMVEKLKEYIREPEKVCISKKPIDISLSSIEVFRGKYFPVDTSTREELSYTEKEPPYTGVDLFRRHIEEANTYTICGCCRVQERYEEQNEITNRNRHTSRHIPFYFKIFGQSRFVPKKNGTKDHTKFNRNVRPKGTHSHFKFYR